MRAKGAVFYNGPSMVDGQPIVAIVTNFETPSKNAKTGAMLQTFILRADVDPITAVNTGQDESICDQCTHRRRLHEDGEYHRTCYVTLMHAPLNVYKAFTRGIYPDIHNLTDDVLDRMRLDHWDFMRLGAYGDPGAVPYDRWTRLMNRLGIKRHTGYSHRWKVCDQRFKDICMASADSPQDVDDANAMGWRTFLVAPEGMPTGRGAVHCPSDPSRPEVHVPCSACGQCSGHSRVNKRNVWIRPHGTTKKFIELKTA